MGSSGNARGERKNHWLGSVLWRHLARSTRALLARLAASRYIHERMRQRASAFACVPLLLLASSPALADRVVALPATGAADPAEKAGFDGDVAGALASLGHTAASDVEARAALARIADGSADTPEEYALVATGARADWVVIARIDPAGAALHVEATAYLVSMGRVESVARDVDRNQRGPQVREMLSVLLRPEGVGVGALPWEIAPRPPVLPVKPPPNPPPPNPPPPNPPPPNPWMNPWMNGQAQGIPQQQQPAVDTKLISMAYLGGDKATVFPAYTAGKKGFVSAKVGFSSAASAPGGASGGAAAFVGGVRGGYAIGESGFELFAELAGNLGGPPSMWLDLGGRYLFTPMVTKEPDGKRSGFAFHVGPELFLGPFFRLGSKGTGPGGVTYESDSSTNVSFGAALDLVFGLSPALRLEAALGNLRVVPTGDGAIVLAGATLGATYRF